MLPLPQHEWWFCQDQDCSRPDRVYGLPARALAQSWLEQLKKDPVRISVLRDLVRSDVALPFFRSGDASLPHRIEELLVTGRLHLHRKKREVSSGSGRGEKNVPFPLASRPPAREASPPPPVLDPPSFSSDVDLSAQAAAMVLAANLGIPFCLE